MSEEQFTKGVEKKKENGPVGSPTSRKKRKPKLEMEETKDAQEKASLASKETSEIREGKTEEVQSGVSKPEVSEIPGDISEDAGKNETFLNSPKPRIRRMAVVGNSVQSTPSEKQADQSAEIKQEDIVIAKKEQDNGVDWKDVQKDFDEEGKKIQEDRTRSMQFNRLDAQESFDEETKRLENRDRLAERFRGVKSFDELSVLLNDPEFPGIQGSKQFYSGDDLKRIIAMARETGATNFATRSHGFLDTVERLLREEKEGKTGALKEDDIVEGFGAVSEKVPEIVFEEDVKDSSLEDKMKNKTERGETFDAAVSDDLKELYGKAIDAQKACDEAGRLYAEAQGREDSLRTKVMSFFRFMKPSLKDEIQKKNQDILDLKSKWQRSLTELRQVKLEIAKQEAKKSGLTENEVKKKMAEVLIEGDLKEAVKVYEEWKEAKRGDRRESKIAKYVEDLVKRYRELPPELKVAVGLSLFLASFIPGAKPLVLVLGIPLRGLGAAGIAGGGKGLHERIAEWFSQREKKAEISRKWNDADLANLQEQAGRSQERFDTLRRKDKRRTVAWAGAGLALFLGGTAFSLAHAASAAERVADGGKVAGVAQKVLDAKSAGASRGTTEEMLRVAKQITGESQLRGIPVPGAVETAVQMPGAGGFASDAVGSGMIDHGQAAEIAGKIGKNISETSVVPEGSSFERVLIEKLTGSGIPKEEAGKLADRAMRDFAEKAGKPFEIFNHIRPGAEIQYEIGSDGSIHVFGVTRKAGGEVIKRMIESASGETSSPANAVQESIPLQSKPFDIPNASSSIKTLPLASSPEIPTATIESPQDIFEQRLPNISVPSLEDILKGNIPLEVSTSEHISPVISTSGTPPLSVPEVVSSDQVVSSLEPPDAFDKYKRVAVAGAAAGAVASAVGGGALIKAEVSEMRARRKAQQEAMRKKEIEEEIEDTRKKNSDIEATQKRANEVIDQVLSIASFPDDRKKFLREVQDRYGVYGDTHPSEEAFRDTMGKIAGVLFGSEAVLQNEDILGNMFLAVAQRGVFSEKEKESLEELRRGIRNGYSVFQGLFLRTGERIPKEKVEGLRVGDVLRLFTERFLTGKMPEELRGSRSNG